MNVRMTLKGRSMRFSFEMVLKITLTRKGLRTDITLVRYFLLSNLIELRMISRHKWMYCNVTGRAVVFFNILFTRIEIRCVLLCSVILCLVHIYFFCFFFRFVLCGLLTLSFCWILMFCCVFVLFCFWSCMITCLFNCSEIFNWFFILQSHSNNSIGAWWASLFLAVVLTYICAFLCWSREWLRLFYRNSIIFNSLNHFWNIEARWDLRLWTSVRIKSKKSRWLVLKLNLDW